MAASAASVKGTVSVKSLIEPLATQAGYNLDCSVSASVQNCVYQGSIMQQIYQIAKSVNAKVIIDNDILRIMPIESALPGQAIFLSRNTGMIGYPTFTNQGVAAECEFNPNIKLQSLITIDSVVPTASGTWRVPRVTHTLSCNMPAGGDWKTAIEAVYNMEE